MPVECECRKKSDSQILFPMMKTMSKRSTNFSVLVQNITAIDFSIMKTISKPLSPPESLDECKSTEQAKNDFIELSR